MYLFVCENYKCIDAEFGTGSGGNGSGSDGRAVTNQLIRKSLQEFLRKNAVTTAVRDSGFAPGKVEVGDIEICRTEKGKPYLPEIPVEFSVSHTGDLWVCLMSEGNGPVGVDIQQVKPYSYEKIAARYYTENEQGYVAQNGADGFFEIWTRKEAYAKYTGQGIGKYLAEINTLAETGIPVSGGNGCCAATGCGDLANVSAENADCENIKFVNFEIKDGIKGA